MAAGHCKRPPKTPHRHHHDQRARGDAEPESDLVAIGLYLYDSTLFKRIRAVEPSARGEYEITDLNKSFLEDERLDWVELTGWWMDCGSTDNLNEARKFADSGKLDLRKTSTTV